MMLKICNKDSALLDVGNIAVGPIITDDTGFLCKNDRFF